MKTSALTILFVLMLLLNFCSAQSYYQDFDGDDTLTYMQAINPIFDTSQQNIWQIGAPHKYYFNSAFSRPNALVTDTALSYPANDTSRFIFKEPLNDFYYGGFTAQWVQKVDMDSAHAIGIVEISVDHGQTWQNAFSSPFVFSFYTSIPARIDTISPGVIGFSGTDTSWEDVWLCLNLYSFQNNPLDTVEYRFTFQSDSVLSDTTSLHRNGWMIDNFSAHLELVHPVRAVNSDPYLRVFPQMTYGPVNIKIKDIDSSVAIQGATLVNQAGQEIAHYNIGPGEAVINIGNLASGWYYLHVATNKGNRMYPVWLTKN